MITLKGDLIDSRKIGPSLAISLVIKEKCRGSLSTSGVLGKSPGGAPEPVPHYQAHPDLKSCMA